MPKIPAMRSKEFLRQLKRFGCEELRVSGSHHRILYPKTGEESTVVVHGSEEHKKANATRHLEAARDRRGRVLGIHLLANQLYGKSGSEAKRP